MGLAEGLLLEWKAGLPANQPGGVLAQTTVQDGYCRLDITTPHHTQWIRLVAALNRQAEAPLAAIQLILRLDAVDAAQPAVLEPMLALRPNPNSARRDGKPTTRSRLILQTGQWYAISGLFHIAQTTGGGAYDFMMNLPEGYHLRIARLDIDWLQSAPHGRRPLAEGIIENVLPFEATALPAEGETLPTSLETGAEPSLRSLSDLLAQAPTTPSLLAGHMLLQAATPTGMVLTDAILRWMGHELRLSQAAPETEPASALVMNLLCQHLSQSAGAAVQNADHLALQTLADLARAEGGLLFGPARPLAVRFETEPAPADLADWQAQQAAGFINALWLPTDTIGGQGVGKDGWQGGAGQVLRLATAGTRLAPLALAFLRTARITRAGAEIISEEMPQAATSWQRLIVGYPEDDRSRRVAGRLLALPGATGAPVPLPLGQMETAISETGQAGSASALTPDRAFALVVLNGTQDTGPLLNIENCLVFNDFAALRAALAEAGPRLLAKPVIPLSRQLPPAADHLVAAVADHWAYGGRYVLTAARSEYDSDTGQIQLTAQQADDIQRLALRAAVVSMPLGEALRMAVEAPLFLPDAGFAICLKRPGMTAAQLAQLNRAYQADQLSSAAHEALALAGPLDMTVLDRIKLGPNWPAEPFISARLMQHRKALHLMRRFVEDPDSAVADAALALIQPQCADLAHHAGDMGAFLLALSARPQMALALQASQLATFLSLAGHAPEADRLARNLAAYAPQICRLDPGLIFPLFELLAACLPPEALVATLCFTAGQCQDSPDMALIRLAECMRRYGNATGLALLLTSLQTLAPQRLQDERLLCHFEAVLSPDMLPVLAPQLGAETIRRIAEAIPPADRFRKAVQAGDRDRALRLAADSDAMRSVDFMRWMDGLRGLSNELRAMALPVARLAVPGINSLPRQRLASVIFSDTAAIADLQEAGLLKGINNLNAVALHILGQNEMLNAMVAAPFAETPHHPLAISGASTGEVFANAQAALAGLPARKDGPLVTAIMSAFNPDIALMEAALGSIAAQTHRNVEIIVIDDASAPDSAAAIRDLVARVPQARLIRLDVNYGPYIGRNLALREAKGQYVAIHDSDDWSHPERFAAQIAAFEATPEARLVTTQHIRIDRAGNVQLESQFTILGDGTMTSLFRRDVFDEIGDFARVRSRGDVEMRERLRSYFGHQAIVALPLPMVLCLADSGTLSQATLARQADYLTLFRLTMTKRRRLAGLRRDGIRLDDRHRLLVPQPLRSGPEVLSQ